MIFHKENQKKVSIIDKIDWYSYEKKKEMEISDYSEISITVLNPRNNVFHLFQFKDEETKNSWLNKLTEVCKHCIEHRKKFLHRMRRKTKTFSLEMMKLVNFKITMTVKEFFLSIFFNFFIFLFFYFFIFLFFYIFYLFLFLIHFLFYFFILLKASDENRTRKSFHSLCDRNSFTE